jgi:hypothetical protein
MSYIDNSYKRETIFERIGKIFGVGRNTADHKTIVNNPKQTNYVQEMISILNDAQKYSLMTQKQKMRMSLLIRK